MPSESDRLLIRQIRTGEQRAWEQLIDRYEGRLLAFAIRRLRERAPGLRQCCLRRRHVVMRQRLPACHEVHVVRKHGGQEIHEGEPQPVEEPLRSTLAEQV